MRTWKQKKFYFIMYSNDITNFLIQMQHKEEFWAEPENKNPLEKTTLSREGFTAQSKEMKDEGAVSLEPRTNVSEIVYDSFVSGVPASQPSYSQ